MDARLRRKQRIKDMKEKGIKPKKRPKEIEPGKDDCGDDRRGLGDVQIHMCDVYNEDIRSEDDEDLHMILSMTPSITEADIFSIIPALCYGREAYVDILEFCGGQGRISKVAFKRGLTSGGNLDLTTGCDLGEPTVQYAINHYLNNCYVLVAILQPNCRSVGKSSCFKENVNYQTWKRHLDANN